MVERIHFKGGIFREDVQGGVLLANRCQNCGQTFFPQAPFCGTCLNDDMDEIELSRRGRLYTYTVTYMPSLFGNPYWVGFVDMPEGVRIFAPLRMTEDKPFSVGMEVEVFIDKYWLNRDSNEIIGYKFKPV